MRTINFGNKSFDTKIQITKGSDFFEIYIPPLGFCLEILFLVPFTIVWNGFCAIWIFMAIQAPTFIVVVMIIVSPLLLLHWAFGIALIYGCLFTLFGKIYFRGNTHEVCLIKTLFGWKFNRHRITPKLEITKIIFKPHSFYANSDGGICELLDGGGPKFELGKHSIELGSLRGGIKQEAEVEWLAYEVSKWLDKPLTIVEAP